MHVKECELSLLCIKVHSLYILQKPCKTISPANGDTNADADGDTNADGDGDTNADAEVMLMLMLMLSMMMIVMVVAISIFAVFEWLHARNKFSTRSNCHMSVLSHILFSRVGYFNDYDDDGDDGNDDDDNVSSVTHSFWVWFF